LPILDPNIGAEAFFMSLERTSLRAANLIFNSSSFSSVQTRDGNRSGRPAPVSGRVRSRFMVVVMALPVSFRGMVVRRNSAEHQQSGHTPRSGPEDKNGRSSAKDGAP